MIVADLIDKLKTMPQHLPVIMTSELERQGSEPQDVLLRRDPVDGDFVELQGD